MCLDAWPPSAWARVCKRLRSSGINSLESIRQAYVAWRACTTNRSYRAARLHRLAESIPGLLKRLQIRALTFYNQGNSRRGRFQESIHICVSSLTRDICSWLGFIRQFLFILRVFATCSTLRLDYRDCLTRALKSNHSCYSPSGHTQEVLIEFVRLKR